MIYYQYVCNIFQQLLSSSFKLQLAKSWVKAHDQLQLDCDAFCLLCLQVEKVFGMDSNAGMEAVFSYAVSILGRLFRAILLPWRAQKIGESLARAVL